MKFEVVFHDGGAAYIVKLEDGSCALVNTELKGMLKGDDPADLMSQGFWPEGEMAPPSDEVLKKIEEVLMKEA